MKRLILNFLFLILLSINVIAANELSVSPTSDGKTANINETISKIIKLSNANTANNLSVSLPSSVKFLGARNNETVTINYNATSPVNVLASSSIDIAYNFTIPINAFNESYTGLFNFTSGGNFSVYSFNLNVTGSPNLLVNNLTGNIGINRLRTFTLTLENKGNTDITASLVKSELISTTNPANKITGNDIVLGSTTLNVPYKKSGTATLKVNVPTGQPKELYVGNVTISYDTKQIISKVTINVSDPLYNIEIPSTIAFPSADQNTTQSAIFTVKNIGNADLTSVNFTSNANTRYNLSFNTTGPFDLGVGEAKSVKLSVFIPQDEKTTNHSIAAISLKSNERNFTDVSNVYADVLSRLEIDSLDFFIDDDIDGKDVSDTNVADGETVSEKAKPGSKIKLDFKIKNRFPEDTKIDINDITIIATIRSIEDDEDAEIESSEFDLEAGKTSTRKVLSYDIPLKVDDDTFRIDIEIEGEDDNGAEHTASRKIFFKVDKRSHDIIINKLKITPEAVECDRKATIDTGVINIGKRNEEDVMVEILNDALGIKFVEENILLESGKDEDVEYEKSVTFNISESVSAGTYPIVVKVYYSDDILDDLKQANIQLKNCKATKNQTAVKEQAIEVEEVSEEAKTESVNGISEEELSEETAIITEEKPLLKNHLFIGLMLLVNTIVIGGVITLAVKFLIPKLQK